MSEKSKKESYVLKSIFHKLKLPQNTVKWRNLKIGAFCTFGVPLLYVCYRVVRLE